MRKISAGLFISMDGVVEAPGQWGFQYMNDEVSKEVSAGISQADAVLLGRRTYLEFAELWPDQGSRVPMADFLNHTPKYVVSATLDKLVWQPAILIKGNLIEELIQMKQSPGKNIQIPGSPSLVRYLVQSGLLDELNLNICPIVVGSGMHLFDETTNMVSLNLVHSTILSNGVIGMTYQLIPAGSQPSELPISIPQAATRK